MVDNVKMFLKDIEKLESVKVWKRRPL
jgi:hypothetical protein